MGMNFLSDIFNWLFIDAKSNVVAMVGKKMFKWKISKKEDMNWDIY